MKGICRACVRLHKHHRQPSPHPAYDAVKTTTHDHQHDRAAEQRRIRENAAAVCCCCLGTHIVVGIRVVRWDLARKTMCVCMLCFSSTQLLAQRKQQEAQQAATKRPGSAGRNIAIRYMLGMCGRCVYYTCVCITTNINTRREHTTTTSIPDAPSSNTAATAVAANNNKPITSSMLKRPSARAAPPVAAGPSGTEEGGPFAKRPRMGAPAANTGPPWAGQGRGAGAPTAAGAPYGGGRAGGYVGGSGTDTC